MLSPRWKQRGKALKAAILKYLVEQTHLTHTGYQIKFNSFTKQISVKLIHHACKMAFCTSSMSSPSRRLAFSLLRDLSQNSNTKSRACWNQLDLALYITLLRLDSSFEFDIFLDQAQNTWQHAFKSSNLAVAQSRKAKTKGNVNITCNGK